MKMVISYKTKQFLLVLIKIGLVVVAFYFIYTKLFQNRDLHFDKFIENLTEFSSISANSILILVLLSFFNWFLEILKWQVLVNHISKASFKQATAQTLGALTASLLTPNRIGDYGAKAMYYRSHLRKKIMLLNLVGNSAQMSITTTFGVLGLVYFTLHFRPELNHNGIYIWFGIIATTMVCCIWIFKTNWFKNQQKTVLKLITFIKTITKKTMFKIVLLSLMRYLIFSFQFYYLLFLFGIKINYLEAMLLISSMYFLSSIIPSIFIFDVVVKGGVAVYLFGLIGVSEAVILSIVTLMWILNFVIPSIIGSYHVLNFKIPKTVS